jgi:hypothetical protein
MQVCLTAMAGSCETAARARDCRFHAIKRPWTVRWWGDTRSGAPDADTMIQRQDVNDYVASQYTAKKWMVALLGTYLGVVIVLQ